MGHFGVGIKSELFKVGFDWFICVGDSSASPSIIFMENAEEMLLPWKSNPNFVPIIITHVITFMVGLAGNIIVICTMSRGHGERSVTR